MAKRKTKVAKEIVMVGDEALYVDGVLVGDEYDCPPEGADLLRACGLRVRVIQGYGLSPHAPPQTLTEYLRYSKAKAQWDAAKAVLDADDEDDEDEPHQVCSIWNTF
jgi:hypothetical protein